MSGGPVMALRSFPGHTQTVLALTSDTFFGTQGFAFRSTDSGQTWSAAELPLTTSITLGTEGSTLYAYAATTSGGVYRSSDGGASWHATTRSQATLVAAPDNSSTVAYAALASAMWRTSDGGATWTAVSETGLPTDLPELLYVDRTNPMRVFAAMHTVGLMRSDDGGATFVASSGGLDDDIIDTILEAPDNTTFYVGTSKGLYTSTTSGVSWTSLGGSDDKAVVLDPAAPADLFVGGMATVSKSTDGGHTFAPAAGGLTSSTFVYALDLIMGNELLVGTQLGVYRTSDGMNWTPSDSGLSYVNVHALAVEPGQPTHLLAGSDLGVYRSTNSGLAWALATGMASTDSVTAIAFDPAPPHTALAIAASGLYRSIDAGATWTRTPISPSNDTGYFQALTFAPTGGTAYVITALGIGVTTDYGDTVSYHGMGLGCTAPTSLAVDPKQTSQMLVGCILGGIYASYDSGQTFAVLNSQASDVTALAFDPQSDQIVYALTYNAFLYSNNGGLSFASNSIVGSTLAIDAATRAVYVGGSGAVVRRSQDFGVTLAALPSDGLLGAVWSVLPTGSGVFAGTQLGVMKYVGP
jgi:photosystem II stability/assembly factor-like uncharacterized protein